MVDRRLGKVGDKRVPLASASVSTEDVTEPEALAMYVSDNMAVEYHKSWNREGSGKKVLI